MLLFQQIEDLAYKHTDARRTIGECSRQVRCGNQADGSHGIGDQAGRYRDGDCRGRR